MSFCIFSADFVRSFTSVIPSTNHIVKKVFSFVLEVICSQMALKNLVHFNTVTTRELGDLGNMAVTMGVLWQNGRNVWRKVGGSDDRPV